MVRREVLRKRLQHLDDYLVFLQNARKYTLKEFISNPERYGSVERFLQLSIECLSDMGNHIIANQELGVVETYSDIPQLLYEAGYISIDLREAWIRMTGFRNILVHGYLEIDREIVYRVLQENLVDIQSLRTVFAQFL